MTSFAWLRARWLTLGVIGFAVLLGVWLGLVARQQWRALAEIDSEYQRLVSLGMPTSDESARQAFREFTSAEAAQVWAEVLYIDRNLDRGVQSELDEDDPDEAPNRFIPGGPWPEEARVAYYLDHMRPVIARIYEACDLPKPTWQPLEFRGFSTLLEPLQASRNVTRILAMEAKHAAYHREAERALRAITAQADVAEAFDWSIGMVSELVHNALVMHHFESIWLTLGTDLWDADQLSELLGQVEEPTFSNERWVRTMSFERGLLLGSMTGDGSLLGNSGEDEILQRLFSVPTVRAEYLRFAREWEQMGADGLANVLALSQDSVADAVARNSFLDVITPALHSYAKSYERLEKQRRLTRTALGMRQFYLQNQAWPERLSELESVGLDTDDYTMQSGNRFVWREVEGGHELSNREPLKTDEEEFSQSTSNPRFVVFFSS